MYHPSMFQNGRVINIDKTPVSDFQVSSGLHDNRDNTFKDVALQGIIKNSDLSRTFFSQVNIDFLQNAIISEISRRSNGRYKIGRQSDAELKIIMRAIFLQYALFQPNDIPGQVRQLNLIVLDEVIPQLMTSIEQHLKYKIDVQYLPVPLEHPRNMSRKGSRQNPSWL